MSLINQMLNDLEKRQATNPETNPLAGRINLTASAPRALPSGPVSVLILVGAALFGAFVWSQFQARSSAPSSTNDNSVQTAAPPTAKRAEEALVAPVDEKSESRPKETITAPTKQNENLPAATTTVNASPTSKAAEKAPSPPTAAAPVPKAAVSAPEPLKAAAVESNVKAEPVRTEPPKVDPAADKVVASTPKPVVETSSPKAVASAPTSVKSTAIPVAPGAMKVVTPDQKSGNLYKQAVGMLQQFRSQEAIELLREALRINSGNHDARILLAGVLADNARLSESIDVLEQGLKSSPEFVPYYRVLARTQATAGNRTGALATLQKGNAIAGNDADFHALYAALLQQQGSHDEAVKHYLISLRSDPMHGAWLVGIAISLQATNRKNDAMEAYKRAIESGELTPDVSRFASEQLTALRQQ